jgi:hypothetical protein
MWGQKRLVCEIIDKKHKNNYVKEKLAICTTQNIM